MMLFGKLENIEGFVLKNFIVFKNQRIKILI
jgi:hypothetical protein